MFGKREIAAIAEPWTAAWARVFTLFLGMALVLIVLTPRLALAQGEGDNSFLVWMARLIPWEIMFGWVRDDDSVAKAIANFILVAGGAFLVALVCLWVKNKNMLAAVLTQIKNAPSELEKFYDYFPALRKQLDNSPFPNIRHAWGEFVESLFWEEKQKIVYNISSPENYFTPSKLGIHFSFYRALPNYFVGVGLLVTFFGLAAALFFASDAINASDVNASGAKSDAESEDILDAIKHLLKSATLKFMASIAGLVSSIILGVSVLLVRRNLSDICADICDELEKRVKFANLEYFALMQLREIQKQTPQLERFNTDLAVSIAEALEPRIQASVSGALVQSGLATMPSAVTSANQKLDTQTEELQKMNREVAGNIAKEIAAPVQMGVAKAMEPLSASIQGFAHNMQNANKEDIQEITRGIPEQMQKAAKTIESAQQAISGVAAELQKVTEGLSGKIGEAGGQFGVKMNEASDTVGKIVSNVGNEITGLKGLVEGLGQMLAHQRQEFESLAKATRGAAVGAAKEAISDVAGELKTASAGLTSQIGEAGGQFGREMDKASRAVGGAVSGISAEVATLRGVVSGFGELLGKQLGDFETLAKATQEAANSLSRAAAQHAQAAQPISSAADKINSAAEMIHNLSETVESTHEKLRGIHEQIGESSAQLREFWERHSERFQGVDAKLAEVVKRIMDGNSAYQENVSEFVVGIAKIMEKALGNLGGEIERLREYVQDLQDAENPRQRQD